MRSNHSIKYQVLDIRPMVSIELEEELLAHLSAFWKAYIQTFGTHSIPTQFNIINSYMHCTHTASTISTHTYILQTYRDTINTHTIQYHKFIYAYWTQTAGIICTHILYRNIHRQLMQYLIQFNIINWYMHKLLPLFDVAWS